MENQEMKSKNVRATSVLTTLEKLIGVDDKAPKLPAQLKGSKWYLAEECLRSREVREYLETEGLLTSQEADHARKRLFGINL